MNKRALMLTAAATALLSGQAYGQNPSPPCSTSTSTASPQLCDITTEYNYPVFTGAGPATALANSATGLGSFTVDTDGSLVVGLNPPQAPAVTINSGTAASPTIVTNVTTISYTGISYTEGVLLEEASVPASASVYGTAENWTGEFINSSGTINLTGAGTSKNGILIAGGAFYYNSSSTSTSTTSIYSDAATGNYPNTAGPTTAPTGLGVFTGGNVIPQGTTTGTSTSPIAIYLESGSTLEVQGTSSYGINLIGPTYTTSPTNVVTPAGGASLIGDIDVGGTLAMTPTTVGSTSATDNVAINIAGWEQSTAQPYNPALQAVGYSNANSVYAMIGNLNILSGGTVTSEGAGAEGVVVLGAMNGGIVNSGEIEAFGTTTPSTATNADDPEGGSALVVANNITGGIFNNGPSIKGSTGTTSATISTVGTSPTIYISPALNPNNYEVPITIGTVAADPDYPNQFSIINRGTISETPEDANNSTSTLVMLGTQANPVTLVGGIFNSGSISATASTNTLTSTDTVTATAVSIGGYTTVNTGTGQNGETAALINSSETGNGKISAAISGPNTGTATAISIAQYADLPSIFNSGTIAASAATTTLTESSISAYAIVDSSGTLTTITNEGTISAVATTLDNNAQIAVAIDTQNNATTPVTITDTGTATGPATIVGNIYFGSKNGALDVSGLNATDYASVSGDIYFGNTTNTHDVLTIGTAGTVTGEIVEQNGGSVDISIAQSGTLNYLTALPTNLNSTVSQQVTKGVPLSVGTLQIGNGGQLNISISQGYNVNVYPGVSVIQATNASIGNPTGGLHPLTISFGSFVATPSATNSAAEFVLIDSKNNIVVSQTELTDLTNLYNGTSNSANGIPYLFTSNICTFNVSTATASQQCTGTEPISSGDSQIVLTLTPKTAQQLGLTGYAAKMFPYVNEALINDNTLGAAMVTDITNQQQAQAAYASFAPDVSGATRATAISLTDSATNVVAARQRELRMYANQEGATTLWGQQWGERLSQPNTGVLTGYNDSGFGFALGMDDGDAVDGRYGGALTFFTGGMSQKEPTSAKTASEYFLLTGYTDWRGTGLFLDTQGTVGYGNLKGKRYLDLTDTTTDATVSREADGNRPTELIAGSVTTGGIFTAGGTVFTPQVDVDGMAMREEAYTEANGGEGFDLRVQPYYAESLRLFAGADVRQDFNFGDFYMQPELRAGYRYDFVDGAVKLKANFASVNSSNGQAFNPFTIEGPDPARGNLVLGGGVAMTTGAWSIGINYDYVRAGAGPTEQTGILTLIGRI